MDLKLDDFSYDLPDDRIAKHPAANRDDSKLLFYNKGDLSHHSFNNIIDLIPKESLLVFNDTRVIPARIILHKDTGARIEIFLLEPTLPSNVHEEVMASTTTCTWKCLIGNAKKWKPGTKLKNENIKFTATRIGEEQVEFKWGNDLSFSELLIEIGKIPLPPYIDREADSSDEERYQNIYAKMKGAVAAPTAGLHFTEKILNKLGKKGVQIDYLTLHVSAGTFQPIKVDKIEEHPMHNEQIWITQENIGHILKTNHLIAVGTTTMRTIESVYWYGVKLLGGDQEFFIQKEDPYSLQPVSKEEALWAVLNHMEHLGLTKLGGFTEIFIYPGYDFKLCNGLITNYHLPGSTLMLLVAAFIGEDWRNVYEEALNKDYRFLSYGDSSFLVP
jgi:S-adenosylmethionine:tRNA ribosyltransferase-isomerase